MIVLRDYQKRVVDELWAWFGRHDDGNCIVAACVGAGKSILIAEIIRQAMTGWPGTRTLMVVASKELLQQNLGKLLTIWPDAPVGVCSAALRRRELMQDITYGTIGSVYSRGHQLGKIDLMFIDECHQVSPKDAGMYRRLIADLLRYNPHMRVIGWTGTEFRGDGVWLTDSDEPLFHGVAAKVTLRELLDAGYLAPLRGVETEVRLDASDVEMRGGDYIVSQLAARIDRKDIVERAVRELVRLAEARQKWLVYGVTVKHAEHILDELKGHGIAAGIVTAETPAAERDATIAMFRAGNLRALVNVAVLTTGFDVPEVDCIALLRNTRSPVLYVQIAGRGMRTAPGKTDCLWLDFTDTTAVLGPVDQVTGRLRPMRLNAPAPCKICPQCSTRNATRATECIDCGFVFDPPEMVNHNGVVSLAEILSRPRKVTRYDVTDVRYYRHSKPGGIDSLRVEYVSGLRVVAREWVCLEHTGYALEKAYSWWRNRAGDRPPSSIATALERCRDLAKPVEIDVDETGKFPEIQRFYWVKHEQTGIDRVA